MKKNSRMAIVSFVLGCIAMLCTLTGDGFARFFAVLLGFVALSTGIAALATIGQGQSRQKGRGLAVGAVCLGGITTLSGLITLLSLFLQQFTGEFGGRHGPGPSHYEAEVDRNRMPNESATNFTSNLPIAILDTEGQGVSKGVSTVVGARFFDVKQGRASVAAQPDYDGLATIHRRGYTTLHLPKPSFTLHTVDNQTNQTKVSLLGLPADADWVLYAPYEDKTLIRDVLAYDLANRMGHYAPRTRYLELFVRSSDRPLSMRDYVGVYVLVEKIKRGKERVNIAKLEATDQAEPEISGGYILKRDHSDRGATGFHSRHGGPYYFVYPKEATVEQRRWIKQYFNSFETALYGPQFANPQKGYAAYLDVDSFIDAFWLVEMSKNVDGFRYSAYVTKDRGGKLKPEPPWDWNRAFGNANYYGGGEPRGWYWTNLRPNEISWYQRLHEDPAFAKRAARRWFALRKDVLDVKKINRRIDEFAAQLEPAQTRNFRRWPVLGRHVTCNSYVGQSYADEVNWLKKWIERRVTWIDSQMKGEQD